MSGLNRREFLKLGAGGVVAGMAGYILGQQFREGQGGVEVTATPTARPTAGAIVVPTSTERLRPTVTPRPVEVNNEYLDKTRANWDQLRALYPDYPEGDSWFTDILPQEWTKWNFEERRYVQIGANMFELSKYGGIYNLREDLFLSSSINDRLTEGQVEQVQIYRFCPGIDSKSCFEETKWSFDIKIEEEEPWVKVTNWDKRYQVAPRPARGDIIE